MNIENINRITLFILMCGCIYLVFVFVKVGYGKIEISKTILEVKKLEIENERISKINGRLYTKILEKKLND